MSIADPNPTVESIHYWQTDDTIPFDVQSDAQDKLNEVLNGNVIVTPHSVIWEAPLAVIPQAAIDSVHDEIGLDEDATSYRCVN